MLDVVEHSIAVFLRRIGAIPLVSLRHTGRMGIFFAKALFYALTPPLKFSRILQQIRFIGLQSTLVIFLTGAFSGIFLTFLGFYTLSRFGAEALLGPMVALGFIKQLGPVLSALIVTGRAGSAVTAEIGIMRISEQIEALELMGFNPFRYFIVPNLLAAMIALPLLTAIFDVVGIFAGYLVGVRFLRVSWGTYFGEMAYYIDTKDIVEGIYKSLSFGVLITWVCCYKGYHAEFGAQGVSKATTQAVVLSSVLILIWDYFMTSVMF